jgi:hypothetical protein
MYYTYAYLREDRTPYYIGKGEGNRAYKSHKRKNGQELKPKNKNQIIILKKFKSEKEAYIHEEYMISIFKRKCDRGILVNISLGGEQPNSKYKTLEEKVEARRIRSRINAKKYRENETNEQKEKRNKKRRKKYSLNKEIINQKRREIYKLNKQIDE